MQSNQKNPVGDISIAFDYGGKGNRALHSHSFHELVFILEGRALQTINGKKFLTSAGDVFIIRDRDVHGFDEAKGLKIFNIGYKQSVLPDEELRKIPGYISLFYLQPIQQKYSDSSNSLRLDVNGLMRVKPLLDALIDEFQTRGEGHEIVIQSLFLQIVVMISRKYAGFPIALSRCLGALAKTVSYVEENFKERFTIPGLADMAGLTPVMFVREFKSAFGISPQGYIVEFRLRKACEMLDAGNKSVTQVAMDCGFSDGNYFSRCFKNRMGKSPLQYSRKG